MGWGFGTWDANGVDNNTGLVKINSVGVWAIGATDTGSMSFTVPSGFTLNYLFQSYGTVSDGRRLVTVSGNTITVTAADDYSANSIPNYAGVILAYVR